MVPSSRCGDPTPCSFIALEIAPVSPFRNASKYLKSRTDCSRLAPVDDDGEYMSVVEDTFEADSVGGADDIVVERWGRDRRDPREAREIALSAASNDDAVGDSDPSPPSLLSTS